MAKRSIKRNNRVIALLACIVLAIGLLPAAALAEGGPTEGMPLAASAPGATVVASGTCDDNLTWTLNDSGTLAISKESDGTGEMEDWGSSDEVPWHEVRDSIKEVDIGDGVATIGSFAFAGCTSLASVTIPGRVGSIGKSAFDSCTSLTSVTIPDSVTFIRDAAFAWCTSLASVKIPSGVTSIVQETFAHCSSLTSVEIPSGVTSIGQSAFTWCTSLTSVTIPGSVESIWDAAFVGCEKLASVNYVGAKEGWDKIGKSETWNLICPDDQKVYCLPSVGVTAVPSGGGVVDRTYSLKGQGGGKKGYITVKASANAGYAFKEWKGGPVDGEAESKVSFEVGGFIEYGSAESGYSLTAQFVSPLTITAKDQECVYNGKQQGEGDTVYNDPAVIDSKVTVEGLRDGDRIVQAELFSQGTNVGTSEVKVQDAVVKDTDGKDVTDEYAIDYKYGTFTIKPAAATVTADSASKQYDGTPLTADGFTCEGLAEGDSVASAKVEGSRTDVGSSANTVSGAKVVNAKGEDVTGCYEIAYVPGTLTVEAAPARKGTLTFDLAGGTLDGKTGKITIEANVGDTIKLPGAPTKKGYAFKFWKGSEYEAGAEYKVEGDHAFTAEWAAVHTVTFDRNGHGTAPDAQEVEHGKKAKRPANPTASGYTFGGWYADKDCKNAYDFSKPVTEDITLYAKWTKKSSSGSGTSPKTGDPLTGAFAIALALAAVSALTLAASRRRRRG